MPDLFTLESSSNNTTIKPPRRRLVYLLPLGLLSLLVLVAGWLLRDKLRPALQVEAQRLITRSEISRASKAGESLFQSTGWIEPDPYVQQISFLTSGTIKAVYIIEGQTVKKGQLLAELDSTDAQLVLLQSKTALEQHRQLHTELQSELLLITADEKELQSQILVAETAIALVADRYNQLQAAGAANVPALDLSQSLLQLQQEKMRVKALEAQDLQLQAKKAFTNARINTHSPHVTAANITIQQAQLAFDRCKVYAPQDGIVQKLFSFPGRKQMLASDNMESTAVCEIYDPQKLQVRVDVPLADMAKVLLNMPAEISCESLPEKTLKGEVTSIVGEADYQRNTLQVKVRIIAPLAQLRPEMLATVSFIAPKKLAPATEKPVHLIPKSYLSSIKDKEAQVYLADANKQVSMQAVTVGQEYDDGLIEISEGLRGGEWLIKPQTGLIAGRKVQWQQEK